MKLSEMMENLPKTAGKAKFYFVEIKKRKDAFFPYRVNNKIFIPLRKRIQFYRLRKGQFLLDVPYGSICPRSIPCVYFGGTDENVFLVILNSEVLTILNKKGINAFYEALKPEIIRGVEKLFGVKSIRQGDIHAARIPLKWNQLSLFLSFFGNTGRRFQRQGAKNLPLFRTDHRLTGLYSGFFRNPFANVLSDPLFSFATGVIKSPNHKPMNLKEVHIIAQTQYLSSYQNNTD